MWINRKQTNKIFQLLKSRPAILITGARQTGKTTLLQNLNIEADYITFDKELYIKLARDNSYEFLNNFSKTTIFDEVQYVPEIFKEKTKLLPIINVNLNMF